MELRQLKYFVEVATYLHYRRAAQQLYVSQSAVSQQIRLLEAEIGVDLFVRSKRAIHRRVELTPAGYVLLERANQLLQLSQQALTVTRQAGQPGPVRLGVFRTLLHSRILDVMRLLAKRLPQSTVKLVELPSLVSVQQALLEHIIDIGITTLPFRFSGIAAIPFITVDMGLLLASQHPLASRPSVTIADLRTERWIEVSTPLNPVFDAVEALCRQAGYQRHIAQEVSSLELLAQLVQLNQGVGLVPVHFNVDQVAGVRLVPLLDEQDQPYPALTLQHVIAYLPANTSLAVSLLNDD